MTVLMGFTALSIDIGLHHYMGARLQNAVDSAATAVAANLGASDKSYEDIAYDYLAKNGYDVKDEKYKDNLTVEIEQKGVGDEELMYEGEYITTGYYKITVDVDDNTLFANVLDIHSLHLRKTAYVKCQANYVEMPRALKYTIFGGSSTGTESVPTVAINGRTGDTVNTITSAFEGFINGINSNLVQPIIGIFGGTPNYNTLVHINLSEVITDGDVHSNSNIAIGVQALNASRVKDQDYEGEEQYNSEAYDNITIDVENAYDDYGQVTYTAVDDITFNNSLAGGNHDSSTHVYVQNQQYLEITQATLNILNTIDFTSINNTSQLQKAFSQDGEDNDACDAYFSDPRHKIGEAQQAEIRNQVNNLQYNAKGSYSLLNQGQIVYNVSQSRAQSYLNEININQLTAGQSLTQKELAALLKEKMATIQSEAENNKDQMYVTPGDTSTLMYQNYADTRGSINYGIKFTKNLYTCTNCGYESTVEWKTCPNCAKVNTISTSQPEDKSALLTIQGTQVNRDLSNLTGSSGASMNSGTNAGARFALIRTFQEHSDYITMPNMKPYFVRQVNTSVRSATKTYDEFTNPTEEATGDKTVKMAVARLTNEIKDVYTGATYEDNTYTYTSDYTNLDTTPLFKYYQASADAALEPLTGTDRTVFNGYTLFNSSGILKDAATHIEEFKSAEFADGNLEESDYGYGAINDYYNDNIKDADPDYETLYAADAVAKKKAMINGEGSSDLSEAYEEKEQWIKDNISYPSEKSVFLVKNDASYLPTQAYNEAVSSYGATTTNSSSIWNRGFWGWDSGYSSSDTWQFDYPINYNTTADAFITYLYSYRSNWYTATNKIVNCTSDGSIATGWFASNPYRKVAEKGSSDWTSGLDFYQYNGYYAPGAGVYIGKSMRFRVPRYMNTGDEKALVLAQNAGLIIDYNTANENSGYALQVANNMDMNSYSFAAIKSNVKLGSASKGEGKLTMNDGAVMFIDGNLEMKNSLTMDSNNILIVSGDLTGVTSISMGDNCKLIVRGSITLSSGLTLTSNNSVISAGKDFTMGGKLTNSKVITVGGDFSITGGSDYISVTNTGKIYVGGDLATREKINMSGTGDCCLYVCGNCYGSEKDESNSKEMDAIWIQNDCKVYIGGATGSKNSKNDRRIWIEGTATQGAVLSVYGGFYNVDGFYNDQSSGVMYLKGNSTNAVANTTAGNEFHQYGKLYCYSDLTVVSNKVDIQNSGETMVIGNATFTNAVLTVPANHLFYCSGTLTTQGVKANGNGAKVYAMTAISLTADYSGSDAGCLTTESSASGNLSEIFCGENSVMRNGMGLNINGYIYYPGSGSDLKVKRLNIGGNGKFVTESNLTVEGTSSSEAWFLVDEGGFLYVGGLTTIDYCRITNYGRMYLMGGYYRKNLPSKSNTSELILGSTADTFIASRYKNGIGTLTLDGYFQGDGNLYIENNVVINGNTDMSVFKVGNRSTGYVQDSGNTYISGYLTTPTDQGINIFAGTSVSCQKNFTLGSAVYNAGKVIVVDGNLIAPSGTYYSDKKETDKMYLGVSWRNSTSDSILYVGGKGTTYFKGYVENYGGIYLRGSIDVTGYNIPSDAYYFGNRFTRQANTTTNVLVGNDENYAPHLSIRNFDNANFHAYSVNTSAMIHNQYDATLATQGDCYYGMCILNGGKFVAFGQVKYSDHQYTIKGTPINHLEVFRAPIGIGAVAVRMGGYAIVNGFASGTSSDNSVYNPNALFYAGSGIDIGNSYYKNVDSGEAVDIGGTVQNWGTMYIDGDLNVYATFQLSYNVSTLLCQPNSNTFVNGKVWVSAVSGIMEGSMFMCQDDYHSRRSTKVGISDEFDDKDPYKKCFVYVGGNMYVNLLGASGKSASWFGLGGTSNSNSSRDMDVYSNSNVYVKGSLYANSKVFLKDNCNLVIEGQKDLYERDTSSGNAIFKFINTIIDADKSGVTQVFAEDTVHNDNYHFFVGTSLDARPNTTIIANGSTYVRDTTKIRDMTKTYINGNFYCANYVEIGKALDGADETEAANSQNSTSTERANYKFDRAGYMYVGGNFTSQRYTKIYASTQLRVKEDFVSWQYLTLRHDAGIYVGKKLKAATSIDGGVFSTFRVNGSMEASGSFIKLRDGCDCFVGGNMTAWSYIELGKYDETIQNPDGARLAVISAGTAEGGEQGYHDKDSDHPEYGQDQDSGTNAGEDGSDTHESEAIIDQKTIDTRDELALDKTDLARGGTYFIGQKLVTYTGYIKEFAYSRVAVGNYVFAPKYITLRSNADMWVLPPSFEQITYEHIPYVPENDGTILGWIRDFARSAADVLSDTFLPHNGSIYTLGELTLNKNASLFGTYDCKVNGQCILRESSLIYLGHDFDLTAPSVNKPISNIISLFTSKDDDDNTINIAGFFTDGRASANGYTFPVVVYADNEINIVTTINMKLTYLVANRGNVNLYNIYSIAENAERNAKQLPNAIASYQGDVNYNAIYGKLGALMYAPNGNIDLDGWYSEIWGSAVGDRVITNAYYMALHRFTNWRTMDLQVAESGTVYLIPQKEYDDAKSNVDDIYMFSETSKGDNASFVPGDRPFYY